MSKPALRVIQGEVGSEVLPSSRESELGLVATALAHADVIAVAEHVGIVPAAFFHADLKAVWEAALEVVRSGQAVDSLTVVAVLQRQGKFEELGGMEWWLDLTKFEQPTTINVRGLAEEVKFMWERRTLHRVSRQLEELALGGVGDRAEWVREVGELGGRLINLGHRERRNSVADNIAEVERLVEAMCEGKVDRTRWVFSSLATFNLRCKPYNSGIQNDGLVLVGGGSGTGKSVFLRQEAHAELAQSGNGQVLFVSAETSTGGLCAMMAASAVGVDLNRLEEEPKDRQAKYRQELARMREQWADKRLFVLQQEAGTPLNYIEDVDDHVRGHVRRYGVPKLICVDYLQLFETRATSARSREQVVAKVSGILQKLQRDLGCPILVAAQLNEAGLAEMRTLKKDDNGKIVHRMPKPGDLRESQRMYHDADRVIFLYKPPVDCRDVDQTSPSAPKPEVWIYQEKRRSGGVTSVRTWFEKKYTRFVELSRAELMESQGVTPAVEPGSAVSKSDWMKQQQKGGSR